MKVLDIQMLLAESNFGVYGTNNYQNTSTHPVLTISLGRITDLESVKNAITTVAVRKIENVEVTPKMEAEQNFEEIKNELRNLVLLKHDNLLKMQCCFVFRRNVYLLTEYCGYGSAKDLINAYFQHGFPLSMVLYLFHAILKALSYLHSNSILHTSLRAEHLLIHHSGRAKLTGFRQFKRLNEGERTSVLYSYPGTRDPGSICYYPPEILGQNSIGYSYPSDVYQLAILLCFLCNGTLSFSQFENGRILLEKMYNQKAFLMDNTTVELYRDEYPEIAEDIYERIYPDRLHTLVSEMQSFQPKARPTVREMLDCPLFFENMEDLWRQVPTWLLPVKPAYVSADEQSQLETRERVLINLDAPDGKYFESTDEYDEDLQYDLGRKSYSWNFDIS